MNFITREDKKRISQSYYYSIEDTCLAVGSTKNHTPTWTIAVMKVTDIDY